MATSRRLHLGQIADATRARSADRDLGDQPPSAHKGIRLKEKRTLMLDSDVRELTIEALDDAWEDDEVSFCCVCCCLEVTDEESD